MTEESYADKFARASHDRANGVPLSKGAKKLVNQRASDTRKRISLMSATRGTAFVFFGAIAAFVLTEFSPILGLILSVWVLISAISPWTLVFGGGAKFRLFVSTALAVVALLIAGSQVLHDFQLYYVLVILAAIAIVLAVRFRYIFVYLFKGGR